MKLALCAANHNRFNEAVDEKMMSSCEFLREFVNQRLTDAAEEIFRVFKTTVLRYEAEIDRQRRLLELCSKPFISLTRIAETELPLQNVQTEEKVPADQHLHEKNSSLDPTQIKKEELSRPEVEQIMLKQETDTFMSSPPREDRDYSEAESGLHLTSSNSDGAESLDQRGDMASKPKEGHQESPNSVAARRPVECDTCGKRFKYESILTRHRMSHTGEKPYHCSLCGKSYCRKTELQIHTRIHMGEKPNSCKTCGKDFRSKSALKDHMRTHTGEKPYLCKICGKKTSVLSNMRRHMRTHAQEEPHLREMHGRRFTS